MYLNPKRAKRSKILEIQIRDFHLKLINIDKDKMMYCKKTKMIQERKSNAKVSCLNQSKRNNRRT